MTRAVWAWVGKVRNSSLAAPLPRHFVERAKLCIARRKAQQPSVEKFLSKY